MYAGHFAIALAIKAKHPQVAAWPIMFGAVLLDMLAGLVTMLQLDDLVWPLDPGAYLFVSTAITDWHHAFVAAILWSVAWGVLFLRRRKLARLAFLAVFSHFLVDWPLHYSDLAAHPHLEHHLGLGAGYGFGWRQWTWEGVIVGLATVYVAWKGRLSAQRASCASIVIIATFIALCPLWPWMDTLGDLRMKASHLQEGLAILSVYAAMAGFVSWIVDEKESVRRGVQVP